MGKQIKVKAKIGDEIGTLTGRFLGFIKDDEFNALVLKPGDVATKLESKATQPLMAVISKFDDMTGYRLIMTVKKNDDETIIKKTLYITEPLDLVVEVSGANTEENKVILQTKEKDTIVVRETD